MKPSSRDRFTRHLRNRVAKIQQEYDWLPGHSTSESAMKAQIGADLFQMRRCLWRMQDVDEPDARSLADTYSRGE